MDAAGRDRYDTLLRHLQAGRELPIRPAQKGRRFAIQVHRDGPRLIAVAIAVALLWVGAIVVTDRLKTDRVDTWTGPDPVVQSGLRLDGCSVPVFPEDSVYPAWVRLDGEVYRWADLSAPISEATIGATYRPTGHDLGALRLFRILDPTTGQPTDRILIRNGRAFAGAVYLHHPDCR